jgi:hypothetical protein
LHAASAKGNFASIAKTISINAFQQFTLPIEVKTSRIFVQSSIAFSIGTFTKSPTAKGFSRFDKNLLYSHNKFSSCTYDAPTSGTSYQIPPGRVRIVLTQI